MAPQELQGVMVALVTPFTEDQSAIDLPSLDQHVTRLLSCGVHGLVTCGSTGEFTTLSSRERKDVLEQTIRSAQGRVPVVAGIGDLSTERALDLAVHAAQVGAAALMVVPPFYDAVNLTELHALLKEIHETSKLPIMYYNIPSASGLKLSPAEIASLSDAGVKYMKDTSGNGPDLTEMLFSREIKERVTSFNGWDTLTFYGLAAGAKGSVWGATNVLPELSMLLWDAVAVRGDLKEGRELWERMYPVCKLLESANYAAGVKTGMELRGWSTGGLRKPFVMHQGKLRDDIAAAIRAAGYETVA